MLTETEVSDKIITLLSVIEKVPLFRASDHLRFHRNDEEFRVWFHCCDDPALIAPDTVDYLAYLLSVYDEKDAQSIFCSRVSSESFHRFCSKEVGVLRIENHKLQKFSNWQDSGWPILFFPSFFLALGEEKPSLEEREYAQYLADEKNIRVCSWCTLYFPLKNGLCDMCEELWNKV